MSEDFYPEKPALVQKRRSGSLAVTITSIVLFVLLFMMFFTEELAFVLSLVVVLLIHELGHYSMMKRFGYENVRMLFVPFMGAFVQGEKDEYSQRESLWVSIMGPFPGVLIGLTLFYFAAHYESQYILEFAFLFVIINLINLLPLDPLDGGSILKLVFNINHDRFTMFFTFASSILMIGAGWMLDSWLMIGFGFLMGFRVRSIQSNIELRRMLDEEEVNYRITYKKLSNRDYSVIKRVLLERIPNLSAMLGSIEQDEADNLMASQVNNTLVSPFVFDASILFKVMVLLYWIVCLSLPFLAYIFRDNLVQYYVWFKI